MTSKRMGKNLALFAVILMIGLTAVLLKAYGDALPRIFPKTAQKSQSSFKILPLPGARPSQTPLPTPSPTPFTKYFPPQLTKKDSYTIFFVGDSMTDALGPHPFRFSQRINMAYPDVGFVIDNYSLGSTNITDLPDLLTTSVTFDHGTEKAILNRDFDILVIESFANNPLSDLPLEEGLQTQRTVLDTTIQRIIREKPQSVIILLATVAPSNRYAEGVLNLPPELRVNYANERRAYLENFIKYATEKDFPFVNTYDDTRLPGGDAKPGFLNPDDNIHPSQQGIEFIQDRIAEYIIANQIIPNGEN